MNISRRPDASGDLSQPPTVLLVEDEFLPRMEMADTLRSAGWRVIEAGTAQSGIDILRSGMAFDVLLTDVQMPGSISGLDLASMVRRERPGVRIVVMSGTYLPLTGDPGRGPFDAFIAKPCSILLDELNELLGIGGASGRHDA